MTDNIDLVPLKNSEWSGAFDFLKNLVDIDAAGQGTFIEPVFMGFGDGHDLVYGAADKSKGIILASGDANPTTDAAGFVDMDIGIGRFEREGIELAEFDAAFAEVAIIGLNDIDKG